MTRNYIFISYCPEDHDFVTLLRNTLSGQRLDSLSSNNTSEMNDNSRVDENIKNSITNARAFIVIVSPHSWNSPRIQKETAFALETRDNKDKPADFPVIPLVLGGADLASFTRDLHENLVAVWVPLPLNPDEMAIREVLPRILEGLEKRLPGDLQVMVKPPSEPLDDLVLELSNPRLVEVNGLLTARATAKLVYYQANKAAAATISNEDEFIFTAAPNPISTEDLSWYLEKYSLWPAIQFKEKAAKIEAKLPEWGKTLFNAVFHDDTTTSNRADILRAWRNALGRTARRFTVFVKYRPGLEKEKDETVLASHSRAAAQLLALPWEILYDGEGYIFQGAHPVTVRRRIPPTTAGKLLERAISTPPLRVLLVNPRPEEENRGITYFDHLSAATPLLDALETEANLVNAEILVPPTFPALKEALQHAHDEGQPYHAVHFDGHCTIEANTATGGLIFESPAALDKLESRAAAFIDTDELATALRNYAVPLFLLTPPPGDGVDKEAAAFVSAALTAQGVPSVVNFSLALMKPTINRFSAGFYEELIKGAGVGFAQAAGQRYLFADRLRMRTFADGKFELHDWFVPMLFQDENDVRLLPKLPAHELEKINPAGHPDDFVELPPAPRYSFVGRSRELLKLERLLELQPYAVLYGQNGEGKTTLAAEYGRWALRTQRYDQAVFLSLFDIYDVRTFIEYIGGQLLDNYSINKYETGELQNQALLPLKKVLRKRKVLLILDNIDSILPAIPGGAADFSSVRFDPGELEILWDILQQLLDRNKYKTSLIFTTSKKLPEPFAGDFNRIELEGMDNRDGLELLQRAMVTEGLELKEEKQVGYTELEALVQAVNGHAQSLVLLSPYVSSLGVEQATGKMAALTGNCRRLYRDGREYASCVSIELLLESISPQFQGRLALLGILQGGGHLYVIQQVLGLTEMERDRLISELFESRLAFPTSSGYIHFHPVFCPYLRGRLQKTDYYRITPRWVDALLELLVYLYQKDSPLSSQLTILELPNLTALLDYFHEHANPQDTADLAEKLEHLAAHLEKPQLQARFAAIRQEAAQEQPH